MKRDRLVVGIEGEAYEGQVVGGIGLGGRKGFVGGLFLLDLVEVARVHVGKKFWNHWRNT